MSTGEPGNCLCGRTVSGGARCPVHDPWMKVDAALTAATRDLQSTLRTITPEPPAAEPGFRKLDVSGLEIEVDEALRRVKIEGVLYAFDLFTALGVHGIAVGAVLRIEGRRPDGTIILSRLFGHEEDLARARAEEREAIALHLEARARGMRHKHDMRVLNGEARVIRALGSAPPKMSCPTCNGTRDGGVALVKPEDGPCEFRGVPCSTCDGRGTVPHDLDERIKLGRAIREARRMRCESMGEMARRVGLSVSDLSSIELGRFAGEIPPAIVASVSDAAPSAPRSSGA